MGKTMLSVMKKKKNAIPEEKLHIFEDIIETYFAPGCDGNEGDAKFMEAIGENFTQEERFRLWEQKGGCMGTGHIKECKAFAAEHTGTPLAEKIKLILKDSSKKTQNIILDEENNTIKYTFACDECCGGMAETPVLNYESCAGGRLITLQQSLGIKLKIKSVDIPPNGVNEKNPCVFTFEIVGK